MRSTAYPPRALRPPILLPTPLTPILLLYPQQPRMNPHLNASSAFPRRVRLSFYLVVIWSRAANVRLTWSSSVLEVPSSTPKRNLPRSGGITRTMPRTRKHKHLKRKVQEPRLRLSSSRLRPPIEGRGGPRGGSAPYADNVRPIVVFFCPIADELSVSLHLAPQDHDDSATEGREQHQGRGRRGGEPPSQRQQW